MIALDTNLLVYAHRRDSEWHDGAIKVVKGLAEGREPWAIPWPCIHEFLAIASHPRIYEPPSTVEAAFDQVAAWLESPSLRLLSEGPGYGDHLASLLTLSRAGGAKIHDARVAALCAYHGVRELWSADRDFSRFPSLKVRNPLVSLGRRHRATSTRAPGVPPTFDTPSPTPLRGRHPLQILNATAPWSGSPPSPMRR